MVRFFSNNQLEGAPQLPPPPPPEFPDQALLPRDNPLDALPPPPPELQPLAAALPPFPPRPGGGLREPFDMGFELPHSSEALATPPEGVVALLSLFG